MQCTGRLDSTKLRASVLADEVVALLYTVTAGFSEEELYGLTSHMRRVALSAPSNTVEGCVRDSRTDYLRFHYSFRVIKEKFIIKYVYRNVWVLCSTIMYL